jgi:hypothetical protein
MPDPSTPISSSDALDNCEFVHGLLEQCLANDELSVPLLPEVAVRVVRMGPQESTNARELADVINADPALTMYVLRIARSAAKRPAAAQGATLVAPLAGERTVVASVIAISARGSSRPGCCRRRS